MRFFHVADVHLGMEPDLGFAWSKRRQEEIWDSFRRLIDAARREKPELLLIAGFVSPSTAFERTEGSERVVRVDSGYAGCFDGGES